MTNPLPPPKSEKKKKVKKEASTQKPGYYPVVDGIAPIVYYPSKFCPGKYKPEYCDKLIEYAKTGCSFEAFGAVVMVGRSTLYDWVTQYQEFSDAKKLFTSLSLEWWEKEGQQGMRGEYEHFRTAVWIYNMRNKFGWKDARNNDAAEPEVPADEVFETQWGSKPKTP